MQSLNERVSTGATAIRDEEWSQRNECFRIYQLSIMEASGGAGLRSGPISMDQGWVLLGCTRHHAGAYTQRNGKTGRKALKSIRKRQSTVM